MTHLRALLMQAPPRRRPRPWKTHSLTQASTPPRRTLDDVRDPVAFEPAIRAINTAEILDGVRSMLLTCPKSDDKSFLQRIAVAPGHQLLLSSHLFALTAVCKENRTPRAAGGPTFLVDIRAGGITSSLIVDRTALEWAFDPRLAHAPFFSRFAASSSLSAPTSGCEYDTLHARPPLLIVSSFTLRPILICADGRPPRPCTRSGCTTRQGLTWRTGGDSLGEY
ncbi:hypothetical protein B0H17DRAFT_1335530 [Mycena rosella]|uniref:Uncharacterized protein n=1 Tax=Mycena rosella TaxID=1033263 RepID=A0AAD7CZ58_MYCRO|nr:hypothetical protein B0H17DRAFT_1335530 [Mycena rosella]